MGWTAPRTWNVSETLTAALMNTHLRDNLLWLANDKPRCGAIRSTVQSISDNLATALSMTDTDEFDTGPMHDTSTNPTRVTVPSGGGGTFHVVGYWSWATNATGRRVTTFSKNGSPLTGKGDDRAPDSTGNSFGSFSFYIPLVATDYIEMSVYQSSGGALNVTGGLQLTWYSF